MQDEKDSVVIRGHRIAFKFPNLRLVGTVERMGFGESFKTTWIEATKDESHMAKLIAAWPAYIAATVENPPAWMTDAEQLTAGEVAALVMGFTNSAMEIRKS